MPMSCTIGDKLRMHIARILRLISILVAISGIVAHDNRLTPVQDSQLTHGEFVLRQSRRTSPWKVISRFAESLNP
jgi:hypothetical protein